MGLPAQIATVFALQSGAYYRERYRETRDLRARLVNGLHELGLTDTVPSVTNFVMCHLPPEFGTVSNLVEGCRERGLFVRDLDPDRTGRHTDAFRIAVKDAATTERMLAILGQVLDRNA
jgi:histidinol-phosphate/aromatic aminotransferase/cobyric acid decarboxylase-like protein